MSDHRHWQQHLGPLIDTKDGFDIIDCSTCGFRHIVPIPTIEELEQVYRKDYYSIDKPMYLEDVTRDLSWWHLIYQDRYEEFERLLDPERRRLLDVGSGPGFFLQYGQRQGWKTRGIEPSRQAAAHARGLGLDIHEGFLDRTSSQGLGRYDVVHLNNVMEHIPSPMEMLSICNELLDPNGILCVGVPNDYSPIQQALHKACGFEPWWVATPHHINYFSLESLQNIMERSGFEIILREATFPIDMFLLMGDNYIGNNALGRACHEKRITFEHDLAAAGLNSIKRKLYQSLAGLGLGREIVLFGRKRID